MRRKNRLPVVIAVTALISGCTGKPTPTDTASETTLPPMAEITTTTVTGVNEEYDSIAELPLGKAFELKLGDFGFFYGIKNVEGDTIFTRQESHETRPSSYALSAECDDRFINAVSNPPYTAMKNYFYRDKQYKVKEITADRIVTGEEISGYSTGDEIFVKYAFVRKTDKGYEFIIDPACMEDIPLWSTNTAFMEFNVNGRTFYGDTIKIDSSFSETVSDIDTEDYVYAKVVFSHLAVNFSTEKGYTCGADLYGITTITKDTDAVIDRTFFDERYSSDPLYMGLTSGQETIEGLSADDAYFPTRLLLIDLDEDGEKEILAHYCNLDCFFEFAPTKIYSAKNGTLTEIGDICLNGIQKAVYNGEEGWVATYCDIEQNGMLFTRREEGQLFFTIKNGTMEKQILHCSVYEDSETKYYYLGEEIVPETTTVRNPYKDKDLEVYEWNGISAYGDPYFLWEKAGAKLAESIYKPGSEMIFIGSDSPYSLERLSYRDVVMNMLINNEIDSIKDYDLMFADYSYAEVPAEKPVLYLYPEEKTEVNVQVSFPFGSMTCSYPEYKEGWTVTAMPDGTLYDNSGNEYYCIYWEGELGKPLNTEEGFCVKGSDTAEFLREKLLLMGLTPREANEFIIYWLPQMKDNDYNVITFHTDGYNAISPLSITPAPDTIIRIFMTFYESGKPVEIKPQTLPRYERCGFTAVEWGGGKIG